MGLSSGPTTKTKTQETATTTPTITNPLAQTGVDSLLGNINNYLGQNPQDFVTPQNSLQTGSYNAVQQLGGRSNANNALRTVQDTLDGFSGQAATVGNTGMPTVANVGNVAAPQFSAAGLAELPRAAQVATPTAASLGEQMMAGAGGMGDLREVEAASLLDNWKRYLDPNLATVVDTSLASYDDTRGREQAALSASMAQRNAFGGSRAALGESQFRSDTALARAGLEAGLRSNAYNSAMNLSNLDAGRRQDASSQNAGNETSRQIANANNATQASTTNANISNNRQLALLDSLMQAGMFNAGQQNQFGLAGFNAANDLSRFNASEANDMASLVYGNLSDNARQNAASTNTANNLGYTTQNNNAQFNAGQQNNMTQFGANFGLDAANTMFGIGNTAQQTEQDRIALQNQLGNSQYQFDNLATQAPLIQNQMGADLLSQLAPYFLGQTANSNGTSTSKQSGGLLNSLLQVGGQLGSAAIMASDRRLKRDIVKLGEEDDGLGVYRYSYVWDEPEETPRFGVMADEVAQIRPWALGPVVEGYATVDYGAL